MNSRIDRVLGELEERYQLDAAFTAQVRPVAEKIFAAETPEDARPALLTTLAELYERQAQVKRDCKKATAYFKNLFNDIAKVIGGFCGIDPAMIQKEKEGKDAGGEKADKEE